MALGGGSFTSQNKIIPGCYLNFISAARANAELSDRGIAALALELDWGRDNEIFAVENRDFEKDALEVFGYPYYADELKGIRDLFRNAQTAYFYKINTGTKASNTYGTAVYTGIRGNALKTVIKANVDDSTKFDVYTYLGDVEVDRQTVTEAQELKDSSFVIPAREARLEATAGMGFSGGTNKEELTGEDYQAFLEKAEAFSFHTLGCLSSDNTVKGLYAAFTRRMREEHGIKFQTVLHDFSAAYEGVINVKNQVTGDDPASLVYWVTGASAGCRINTSNTNKKYDGEFQVTYNMKQSELEASVRKGEFVFHKVGTELRVLEDINSLNQFTPEKNKDFSSNQVIRILDQIGNDIAVLFNTRYLGRIQNNEAGRVGLWNDLVSYARNLEKTDSIESFTSEQVSVAAGTDKKSIVVSMKVTPSCAMGQLYMTVTVA